MSIRIGSILLTILVSINFAGSSVVLGGEEQDHNSRQVCPQIYENFDRYSRPVRNYVGENLIYAGCTSPSGYKYDIYGDIKVPIRVIDVNGDIVDVYDEEELGKYTVVSQFPEADTRIKVTYVKNEQGIEYDCYPKEISVEEIVLYVIK